MYEEGRSCLQRFVCPLSCFLCFLGLLFVSSAVYPSFYFFFLFNRQPHAAPSDSPTDAEIFSSFEARNIIAAAAAKRAAAAAAAATAAAAAPPALAKVAAALKAKPTAGPALNANRKRDAVRVSNFNQTSIKMKQNNTKQKQQRTPQRRSFRLATLQVRKKRNSSSSSKCLFLNKRSSNNSFLLFILLF